MARFPNDRSRQSEFLFLSARHIEHRLSWKRRRRGASTVELAVIAPVLFLLLFGVIEFGRMVMVQQALTNAAREGCREATLATTLNSLDVETTCRNYLQSVIADAADPTTVTISVNPAGLAGITPGTAITVDTSVNFSDVTWLPGNFLDLNTGLVLLGHSTQRRE